MTNYNVLSRSYHRVELLLSVLPILFSSDSLFLSRVTSYDCVSTRYMLRTHLERFVYTRCSLPNIHRSFTNDLPYE